MPVAIRRQIFTTEEKFNEALRVLGTIRNQADQDYLRNFIMEIAKRYIDKDKELEKYVSQSVKEMNAFERSYIETIIQAFTA